MRFYSKQLVLPVLTIFNQFAFLATPRSSQVVKVSLRDYKVYKMEVESGNNSVGFLQDAGYIGTENGTTIEKCNRGWLRWVPTSASLLEAAESRILSYMKTKFKKEFVNIGPVVGQEDCLIRTISYAENNPDKTPLVLVHGFGAGVGLWSLNLDEFAKHRPVYAFDLLGFGRSSRPTFSSNANETENEMVQFIEAWRKEMGLERFVLLGHSMGGFLATAYSLQYPERVSHLILADPWGYSNKPADTTQRYPMPFWVRLIFQMWSQFNPLWILRAAGPWGPDLIKKRRPDLARKFAGLGKEADSNAMEYIYHCNSQTPSGESAFHSLMDSFAWSKNPMINRIDSLSQDVPMTFIYGGRSFIDLPSEESIKEKRPNLYVDVKIMEGAGHHVYADNKEEFNSIVLGACEKTQRSKN